MTAPTVLSRRRGNPFHPLKTADDPLRSLLFASLSVYISRTVRRALSTVSGNRLRDGYRGKFRSNCPAPPFHTGYESQWAVRGVYVYTHENFFLICSAEGGEGRERRYVVL